MQEEIVKIVKDGVPEKELVSAKNMLLSRMIFGMQSNNDIAEFLGYVSTQGTLERFKHFEEIVNKLTSADLQRVAQQYLSPLDYVTVEILPLELRNGK